MPESGRSGNDEGASLAFSATPLSFDPPSVCEAVPRDAETRVRVRDRTLLVLPDTTVHGRCATRGLVAAAPTGGTPIAIEPRRGVRTRTNRERPCARPASPAKGYPFSLEAMIAEKWFGETSKTCSVLLRQHVESPERRRIASRAREAHRETRESESRRSCRHLRAPDRG